MASPGSCPRALSLTPAPGGDPSSTQAVAAQARRACPPENLHPLTLPQAPRGRPGPAGSRVRAPGGGKLNSFGLFLPRPWVCAKGTQVT